jgi:hypothetical protein
MVRGRPAFSSSSGTISPTLDVEINHSKHVSAFFGSATAFVEKRVDDKEKTVVCIRVGCRKVDEHQQH